MTKDKINFFSACRVRPQPKKKGNYIISGKVLNASKLIDDLIFEDSTNKKIFET